jgi:hypothetical protein
MSSVYLRPSPALVKHESIFDGVPESILIFILVKILARLFAFSARLIDVKSDELRAPIAINLAKKRYDYR